MKIVLLILACAGIAGCGNVDERYPEALAAMRDPLFDQWLKRNNLEVISVYPVIGCTRLHVRFVDEKGEGK